MKFIVDCVTARKITADVAVQFLQVQFIVERVVINVGMDRPATLAMAMIACFVIARSAATQYSTAHRAVSLSKTLNIFDRSNYATIRVRLF